MSVTMDNFILYPTNVVTVAFAALAITTTMLNSTNAVMKLLSKLRTVVLARWEAWAYLFNGPKMLQKAFDKSAGRPFTLESPDKHILFVSSPEHITEVINAPDTDISLLAAAKQMLQPNYSMHGFNWFDTKATNGTGVIKAVRTLLTNHLPAILPDLRIAVSQRLHEIVLSNKVRQGGSHVKIYPTMVQLVALTNSLSFFGHDLAKNEAFMKAAVSYVEETWIVAEFMRLLPHWLAQIVAPVLRLHARSQKIMYGHLITIAEERVRERDSGYSAKTHNDCIQWVMETSPKKNPWSAQRIVLELMAIWFGSVHAVAITVTFAVEDLCVYPEYIEPIREELSSQAYSTFEKEGRGLPLLDSFMKESARLTPLEAVSSRRVALNSFTFRDGTTLKVGDLLCTPAAALMQHGANYPEALSFNGFRFVDPKLLDQDSGSINHVYQDQPSKFTDADPTYLVWGPGKMACPGRYYAAAVMKVLIAAIIQEYDIKLVEPEAKRWWTWRCSNLPLTSTMIKFTAREGV